MASLGSRARRTFYLATVVAAASGLLVLSFAISPAHGDEPRPDAKPPATRPAGDRPAEAAKPRPKARPMTGRVVKVEDGVLRLLTGDAGREVTVPLEPDTEIFVNGEAAKVEDLQREWIVAVTQEKGLTRTIEAKVTRVRARVPDKGAEKARGDTRPAT